MARKVLSEDAEGVIYWIADLQRIAPSKWKSPHNALFLVLWLLEMVKEYAEKNTIKRIELTESGYRGAERPIDPFRAYVEHFHGSLSGSVVGRTVKDVRV